MVKGLDTFRDYLKDFIEKLEEELFDKINKLVTLSCFSCLIYDRTKTMVEILKGR